jgi:hypothetical protein
MANQKQQPSPSPKRQIQIELPPDLEATYANFVLITHSPSEMILDFARMLPNTPKTRVYARIIMTPMNAKLLYRALGDNLARFEESFGEIKTPDRGFDPTSERMGFVRD